MSNRSQIEQNSFLGATVTKPANSWTEAFLSGNGEMGLMVYGEPYSETLVLNHCKLYLPVGSREIVYDLGGSMPVFKAAGLAAGINGPAEVHRMMIEQSGQEIIGTDPFHPACFLKVDMDAEHYQDYRMKENFRTGEITASWLDKRGRWQRKAFVSRPDKVAIMEIAGPDGEVGCSLSLSIDHELVRSELTTSGNCITAHAVYVHGKGGYDIVVQVENDGGVVKSNSKGIDIAGADKILLKMKVETWRAPLPKDQSEAWAFSPDNPDFAEGHVNDYRPAITERLNGITSDYGALLKPHADVHGELFSRVKLDLHSDWEHAPDSEELLSRAVAEDHMSPELMEMIYDACRYLTISSTGERPPNLQGIWTGTWNPAWSGDYTIDSNLQLEIQSLLTCGMPELMESYFDLVESWLPDCRLNAQKLYGCRGLVSNARASNTCLLLHWGDWPGEQLVSCMGWLAHFFYDYYQFTGDRLFLAERVVPLLREIAMFYGDLLAGTEDEHGTYRFFISYSPEHMLAANATFDISVVKAILGYLVAACEELNIESENVSMWKVMLDKLPKYVIDKDGALQEWAWIDAPVEHNHRHHSHFLPLYQFGEIDQDRTPDLWEATKAAFNHKVQRWFHQEKDSNSNHITHGMMNQGQCAARLGRGDVVYEVLSRMATRRYLFPSFMISYWPDLKGFGLDPVGTIPDIVNNSLVYAWDGVLDLIPALPREWPTGSISGVLARGQLRIDNLLWDRPLGQIDLSLTSGKTQKIDIRMPLNTTITSAEIVTGSGAIVNHVGKPNRYTLSLHADRPCQIHLDFREIAADVS